MKISVILALTLALFSSILAFNFIWDDRYTYHGLLVDPPRPAPDFVLTDVKTGQPFYFGRERGEVTLLYFGYTQCPDVCPTTMGVWKQVKQALGPKAERVRFIFITVDPERDTSKILATYMRAFDDGFIGLRGEPDLLAEVIADYGIWVEKTYFADTAIGYAVNHTASTFLIDRQGTLRVQYPFGTLAEAMIEDITHLLK